MTLARQSANNKNNIHSSRRRRGERVEQQFMRAGARRHLVSGSGSSSSSSNSRSNSNSSSSSSGSSEPAASDEQATETKRKMKENK